MSEELTKLQVQATEVKRDKDGMWLHPGLPWEEVGEDVAQCMARLGYEPLLQSLESDAPTEIQERYFESNDPNCSYWIPTTPTGEGWFLAAIFDTEDGPVALWIRPKSAA